MIPTFFKYLNSNHNTLSYLPFSKCFSWFLYLGVQRGTGVFRVFFFHSSSRAWLALHGRFTLASVWPKNAEKLPVLQIQASSVKIRVRGFLFLVSLHIKTDGKTNFFYYDINMQIRRFLTELVESRGCEKYCLIITQIWKNTALLAFSLGV